MRKIAKIAGWIIGLIVLVIIAITSYVGLVLPNVGDAPDLTVDITPERVHRGEYIANTVAVCIDCHSKRDWTLYGGPIVAGTEGGGGEIFDQKLGFPGVFYSKNITPYGLRGWTDGEIFRAITTGVNKDGEPLFPVMPYHNYGKMDKEDVYSIIAYLRTMPEVKNDVPPSVPDFPFSLIMNTIPQEAALTTRPPETDTIAYGGYLVQVGGCADCHTPFENNASVAGMEFAGGRAFEMPFGTVRTPNITPHPTGLGSWSREMFISRFKMYGDSAYHPQMLGENDFNTLMPWAMYGRMKEADLASIYAYLKQVKPIDNQVEKFSPRKQIASK